VAIVAILSTAVGVAAMIVATSLMSGVQIFILDHFRGTNADIRVRHFRSGEMIRHWDAVERVLRDELVENGGELVAIAPRMVTPALIVPGAEPRPELEDRVRGVELVGIDFALERAVTPFDQILERVTDPDYEVPAALRDNPLPTRDGHPTIILGESLARSLGVSRSREGGFVTLLTGDLAATAGAGAPKNGRPRKFRVIGCYSTGMQDYDKITAYIDRQQLRRLRFDNPGLNVDASRVHVRVTDPDRATELAADLMARHPSLICTSWLMANRTELLAIEDQKRTILLILFSMVIIASAAILGIVYMMVVEKTRDIGILRSMGLGTRRLVGIFTVYGLLLGVIGTALGVLLGLQLTYGIDGLIDWLSGITGKRVLDPGVYKFTSIPVHVDVQTVSSIVLASVGMSLVAAWLPAWLRMRAWSPVRCLRAD